jgi:hypothetical protein
MFIISQYLLNNLSSNKLEYTSIYAIAIGLVVYACIYLYFLFYNEEFLSIFNKFIIYIIGIDLLLSSFYYANTKNSLEYKQIENSDNFSDDTVSEAENIFEEEDIFEEDIFEEEDILEDKIQENLLDQHHIHTENLLKNDEFNIESDVESNLDSKVPEKISLDDLQPQHQTDEFVISEHVEEQIKSNEEQIKSNENIETVLNQETKRRRGRKPNSLKLNF